jgi:hypothetical protein
MTENVRVEPQIVVEITMIPIGISYHAVYAYTFQAYNSINRTEMHVKYFRAVEDSAE